MPAQVVVCKESFKDGFQSSEGIESDHRGDTSKIILTIAIKGFKRVNSNIHVQII